MLDSRGEGGGTGVGSSEDLGASYNRDRSDSYGLGDTGQSLTSAKDLDDEIPF